MSACDATNTPPSVCRYQFFRMHPFVKLIGPVRDQQLMNFCLAVYDAVCNTGPVDNRLGAHERLDARSRYALTAAFQHHYQKHWESLHGVLPEIHAFGHRKTSVSFAPKTTVFEIPSRRSELWKLSGDRYVENTKAFDGKRFRMYE